MRLDRVAIERFRNLQSVAVEPHAELNLLTGRNGAGKSSILEALQCLSTGHSFRTRKSRELIQTGADHFQITAEFSRASQRLSDGDSRSGSVSEPGSLPMDQNESRFEVDAGPESIASSHRCGLARYRDGTVDLRLDFQPLSSFAELSGLLPVRALSPDSHALVQEGPEWRRQFLDWGVFHVEPRFIDVWRSFRRSLRQRNQLLREQANDQEISAWDEPLATAAERIDDMRQTHVHTLSDHLSDRLAAQGDVFHVELHYRPGWKREYPLIDLLSENLDTHRRFRTTTDGPHRADLAWTSDNVPLRQWMSRGQQKAFVYLIHLAQLDVVARPVIVLCDDLASELDDDNAIRLVEQLHALRSQVWVSGVSLERLKSLPHRLFHVERGGVENSV